MTAHNEKLEKRTEDIREDVLDENARFYETFEQAAIGICHVDLDYKIIRSNAMFCDMLGLSQDELTGSGILEYTFESDIPESRTRLERLSADPESGAFSLEKRCHTKDGGYIWVEITTSLSRPEGSTSYFICFITDVTSRVALQHEIAKNEQRYEILYEDAPLSYQSLDHLGNIMQINKTWLDTLGYEKEEVLGHSIADFIAPEEHLLLQERFESFLQNGFVHNADFTMLKKDGKKIIVNVEGRVVHDRHDGQTLTHCILEDITKEREALNALDRSEKKLSRVIDATNLGVWDWEYQSGHHEVNENWLKMLGLTHKGVDLDTEDWASRIHPDDKTRVDKTVEVAIESDAPYVVEFRMRHSDGHWVWIEGSGAVVERDSDGRPLRLTGTHQDISHRKREQEREAIFNSVMQQGNDAIYLVDVESGYIVDVNETAIKKMGFTRQKFLMMHVTEISEEMTDMQTWKSHIDKVRSGKRDLVVTRHRRHDGTSLDVEVSISLVVLDGKEYSLAIVRDISERLEAEARQQMLAEIIDQSTNEFYLLDRETMHFKYVNQAAAVHLGYEGDEFMRMEPADLDPHFTADAMSESARPLFTKEKKQLVFEASHRRKDGSTYPIEVRLQLVNTIEGESLLAVILDITDRKRAEEKVKEQEEILFVQSRHAAMGEMISMIAHQWRQPLSVISMLANNLLLDLELESLDPVELKNGALGTLRQTQYLSKTIDDFREFFRPTKPKSPVDVALMIEQSLNMMGGSLTANGIVVTRELGDESVIIDSYASELIQVLLILFNNAKDAFMDKREGKKEITITVDTSEEEVKVHVCDNAGGIKETILDKIFEPYFLTKDDKNGTGIGLYMSKLIIERHMKGKIIAVNRNGGACFTLTLH